VSCSSAFQFTQFPNSAVIILYENMNMGKSAAHPATGARGSASRSLAKTPWRDTWIAL